MFQPRPKQLEVLAYTGGRMGVSAVPGSGKTQTLSYLAAQLVAHGDLADDQEVLVVTLVNSAVDNFARRVAGFVQARGLLPHVGYRVRTLHGLAYDIVRERPGLVGLADDFQIVDERDAGQILQDAAEAWLSAHPYAADDYLDPLLEDRKRDWVRRDQWPRLVSDIAASFIRQAKDLRTTPPVLRYALDELPAAPPLVEMGYAIYADYQRGLTYRGAVDYDDLIRLALLALELDGEYLSRLRARWPYILEDEAQDSSELQERILRLLVGPNGNWVRVGDPNQAIFETFTTASPRFLRDFLAESGVVPRALPNSGRATQSIMDLANHLVDWSRAGHPVAGCRDALAPSEIKPTPPGDPQPNPPDDPSAIHLVAQPYTPEEELKAVVTSLVRWLPENGDKTVAVLVPRNDRGEAVVSALKTHGLDCVELLRSTRATREAAGALANVVNYLADPAQPGKLATAYKVWRRADRADTEANARLQIVVRALQRRRRVEEFLWPPYTGGRSAGLSDRDGLDCVDLPEDDDLSRAYLQDFRELVRRWQGATLLPIDQLILTIAQDLFDQPADLALAHKLAVVLRQIGESHPDWRLPELTAELATIAKNERKFLGFTDADTGFDPEKHRGVVVVATAHKAKGLEWDRVYLMSANNYDFPSAQPHDSFIAERWFVRDRLNLEAEALAQLKAVVARDLAPLAEPAGQATAQARVDYAAERLRLLYVCITRARRELIITWNTGRRPNEPLQPATPLIALQTWWEKR
ncbi:MAG: ATP-dependent helicase [Chloroflexi bacterium HGW-Chloroflexi-1]|nr:MAG: ATP-dependent helicase [Chloroflexi bacterium HGW-Chloroflexi-1]